MGLRYLTQLSSKETRGLRPWFASTARGATRPQPRRDIRHWNRVLPVWCGSAGSGPYLGNAQARVLKTEAKN